MKNNHRCIPSIVSILLLFSSNISVSDVKINGFASLVGGLTTSEGEARSPFDGSVSDTDFVADGPSNGRYNDKISFKPDSVYGLQISSDLSDGLSVTGQITGAGGENFDANVAWAYLTYEFNENVNLQMGRQRLPLFFYSDFLDVGYSYHWIRPPTEVTGTALDDYEGVQVTTNLSTDNWDTRFQLYAGASLTRSTVFDANAGLDNTAGIVAYTTNDWLQLRATYVVADLFVDNPALTRNGSPQNQENPSAVTFWGLAAHATLGKFFVVSEYTTFTADDPIASDVAYATIDNFNYYVSAGFRIGNVTPHITFSVSEADVESNLLLREQKTGSEAITVGLRWDFHPQATFKVEYLTRDDTSDDVVKSMSGIGNVIPGAYLGGRGDVSEVDVFAFGVDLVF